jgi:hypothetical protein
VILRRPEYRPTAKKCSKTLSSPFFKAKPVRFYGDVVKLIISD